MNLRKLLLPVAMAIGSLFTGTGTQAQVSDYTFAQSTGTYTPVTGGTTLITATGNSASASMDSYVDSIATMPFAFIFNGVSYTKCYVSSNGFITFGTAAPSTVLYTPISTTVATTQGVIAAWARDINTLYNLGTPAATGDMRYGTVGAAPNRQLVIQWTNFRPTYTTSSTSAYAFDFQIILEETTNKVYIKYGGVLGYLVGSTSYASTVQIGLRGTTTSDFNNRTNPTSANFTASTAGTTNSATQAFSTSATPPGMPTAGLTYAWTPGICSGPPAFSMGSVTTTGVTFSWTAPVSAPANGYEYEVRTSGAAGSGATGLTASGTTIAAVTTATVNTLSPATTYSVYVRSNCGSNSYSGWILAFSFTTLCNPVTTYPYIDTFSSSGLPGCWSASNNGTSTYNWTGTAADATYGVAGPKAGSGFVFLNVYNASNSDTPYWLTSRPYAMGTSPKQLQYYYFLGNAGYKGTSGASGSDPYPLQVLISTNNGSTWDTLYRHSSTNSTFATNSAVSNWTQNTINLANYAGQTVMFRFVSASNYGSGRVNQGLDEIGVMDVPSCFAPTGVTATAVTNVGATLGWTAPTPAPASGYQYEVRTSGAAGSGSAGLAAANTTGAGVTTANITSLSGNTKYSVYVRSNCGGTNGYSTWTLAYTFTTLCDPITTLPWNDGIESVTTVGTTNFPSCWKKINGDWRSSDPTFTSYNVPRTGSRYLTNAYTATNEWMMTPGFQLTAGTSYDFNFYWAGDGYNGWTGDIGVNTIQDSTGATILGSSFVTSGTTTTAGTYTKATRTFIPPTTGTYYFGIRINANGTPYYLGFDDFSVRRTPTCFEPTNVTVSNITTTGATINWTAPTPAPANGYRYEVRSSGAPGSGATGRVATGTTAAGVTTINITGLTANTADTVYVRALCSASDSSDWTGAVAFRTPCAATLLPVAEGFNNSALPACWSTQIAAVQTASKISFVSSGSSPTTSPYAGSGMVLYNAYSSTGGGSGSQERLISLPVSSVGFGGVSTRFYWRNENNTSYTNLDEAVQVQYSTDGATWTDAGPSFPRHDGSLASGTAQWNLKTVFLPAAAANQATLYVAYRFTSKYGDNMFMDSVRIEGCTNPVVNLGNDTAICVGNTLTLNAGNAGSTYLWNTGATTQSISVTTAGTYSVAVTNAGGCTGRDTLVVTDNPQPVVNLGVDTTICAGSSITLNAGNAGASFLWSTGATTQTISVSTAGTYGVRVTNATGCITRDTVVVVVSPRPTVNLGIDTAICSGSSLTLDAGNNGATYLWSTGATTQSISVTTAGTYSVRVTNAAGCIGRDTIVVGVNARPVVNLGNNTAVCAGNSVTLNAGNAGASFLWSTGATTQSITVNTAGTYSVQVTNASGCIGRDTVAVSINPLPTVNLGADTAICIGNTLTLNAGNAGATYLWSTGAMTPSINVTTAGTYGVRVTSAAGCIGRDTINVSVNPLPVVNLGADTSFCSGLAVTLNAGNAGATYLWNTGATTQTISVAATGTYSVRVTNANGCNGRDSVVVTVNPTPSPNLGIDTIICSGSPLTLNAGSGATYLWNTGATTQTISVAATGTYSVRVISASGCVGRDSILVAVHPLPVAGTITTTGQSPTFTFTAAGNQHDSLRFWAFGDGTIDTTGRPTTTTHTYTANGTYTVKFYVINACGVDSASTTVTVSGVGIKTVTFDGLVSLFPNPASDFVTIRNTSAQALKNITVLSAVGAVVHEVKADNGKEQRINISGLAAGTYLVRIELEGATVIRRLQIKE